MLKGSAITPVPAIVVSFRSFDTVCGEPLLCTVEVADTALQRGQGMHGSFSRADTKNFMAFSGPDFKAGFVDTAPTSNADITATVIELLDFKLDGNGKLVGRLLGETLRGGIMPQLESETIASAPAENGVRTWSTVSVLVTPAMSMPLASLAAPSVCRRFRSMSRTSRLGPARSKPSGT